MTSKSGPIDEPKKGSASILASFFGSVTGNSEKMLNNAKKKRENANQAEEERAKKMKKDLEDYARQLYKEEAPMMREKEIEDAEIRAHVKDALEYIIYGVEVKRATDPIDLTASAAPINTGTAAGATIDLTASDVAAPTNTGAAAPVPTSSTPPAVKGKSRPDLTWNDRAVAIFCYLHPNVFGSGDMDRRIVQVASTVGASPNTVRQWVSLQDKGAQNYICTWHPIVKGMRWADCKKHFRSNWLDAYKHIPGESTVADELLPYAEIANKSQTVIVSKFSSGILGSSSRKRMTAAKKSKNIKAVNLSGTSGTRTKRMKRKDSGAARKNVEISDAVEEYIQHRWESGDPASRHEAYDMIRCRDDCAEGSDFHNRYLLDSKKSALAMFVTRCLDRMNYCVRKNSIGQKVPADWRERSEVNVEEIVAVLKEAKVEVVINADQTFIRYYPESDYVCAPKGAKRIGGNLSSNEKSGFTLMVGAELNSSSLVAPFVVFDGTKKKSARNLQQTSWWKYRNWKSEAPGRTATVTFHPKHWFDEDISIEYLEHLLELYPGKKIGVIWDACRAHTTPLVLRFLEEHSDRIVCVGISGGLTSVIQVCDLVANKDLKQFIKNRYYTWRTEFIKKKRAELIQAGTPSERITIKIPRDVMIKIVEEAIKEFNEKEQQRQSIRKTFRKVKQDPWNDSSEEFKAHLDSLEEDAMYKALYDNQTEMEVA